MVKPDDLQKIKALERMTDLERPKPEEVKELRKILSTTPDVIQELGRLSTRSRNLLLASPFIPTYIRESLTVEIDQLSMDLEYNNSTHIEQLLIDNILSGYLRYHFWEITYHDLAGRPGMELDDATKWEKLLSSSQRRYYRSIEALIKIRRLGINVQVNIATNGGQQINMNRQKGGSNGE